MKKLILSCLSSTLIGLAAYAQGNDCATAPLITQGSTCVATYGTTAGATQSMAGCAGTADDDVWYRFVATSTVANIYAIGDGDFDMVFQVFSGTCGSLVSLVCEDNTADGEEESTSVGGLVVGQTYYLRIYDYYGTAPSALTFSLCITAPCGTLAQPVGSVAEVETCGANINAGCNATPSPAYQDITCGTTVWGSLWANGGSRDTDWYRFTVTTPTTVNWTVASELPAALLFVDISNCASPTVIANALTDGCTPEVLSYNFTTPGTYVAFVAPSVFEAYPCGTYNDYYGTLTMTTTAPVISAGGATTFCSGGSVNLTSTGTGTFVWNNGGTPIGGATASSYSASVTGNYNVQLTDANGCKSNSNSIAVTVNAQDNATFTYPTNSICDASPNQTPTTSTAGLFSATPAGLNFVSASTGEIDVAGSTAGSYSVTYTTSGSCPNASTQTIVISGAPDATFTYAQSSYCASATNPSPVFGAGASAGTFSSTTGLIINPTTGVIDLASSSSGTYTVTNSIAASGSCPAATETFVVTIVPTPTATVSGGGQLCGTGTIPVTMTLTGAGPWDITYTDGTTPTTVNGIVTSPYTINASTNGTYTVSNVTMGTCSNAGTGSATVTFNPNPTPTVASVNPLCSNASTETLVGTPANGTYTGTGITGNTFDPSVGAGSYSITYTVTDGNGCTGSTAITIVVNAAPTVSLGTFSNVCIQSSAFALTGGLPAGGTYTGTGVSAGNFDPATAGVGTQNINYSFTDVNNCTSVATQSIDVQDCAGLNEWNDLQVDIVPNPANTTLYITSNESVQISLVSIDGKTVLMNQELQANSPVLLDVTGFARGVYYLQVVGRKNNSTKSIVLN
jgi:hypothetical protein